MLFNLLKSTRSSCIRTYSTTTVIPPLRPQYQNLTSPLSLAIPKVASLANKFETWEEVFTTDRKSLKGKGFTCQQRKAIFNFRHQYSLGFDQLKTKKHKSPPKLKKK